MLLPFYYVDHYVMLGLFVVIWTSIGYWVHADASARGIRMPIVLAGLSAFLLPMTAYYLLWMRRSRDRSRPVTRRTRLAAGLAIGAVVAVIAGSAFPLPSVASRGVSALLVFVVAFPVAYRAVLLWNPRVMTGA